MLLYLIAASPRFCVSFPIAVEGSAVQTTRGCREKGGPINLFRGGVGAAAVAATDVNRALVRDGRD